MTDIMIVVGHSMRDSYCEALGEAYRRGAGNGRHAARLFVLSRMTFDPVLRGGYREAQPLEPDLAAAHEALTACDHLVLIFPLWCGDMPAILKGFIERLLQPDLLQAQAAHAHSFKLFGGKSARVIMTMGMPGLIYRWWFGAHALKLLKRNILGLIGIHPVRSTIHGLIEGVSAETRARWLRETEALGRDAR